MKRYVRKQIRQRMMQIIKEASSKAYVNRLTHSNEEKLNVKRNVKL